MRTKPKAHNDVGDRCVSAELSVIEEQVYIGPSNSTENLADHHPIILLSEHRVANLYLPILANAHLMYVVEALESNGLRPRGHLEEHSTEERARDVEALPAAGVRTASKETSSRESG